MTGSAPCGINRTTNYSPQRQAIDSRDHGLGQIRVGCGLLDAKAPALLHDQSPTGLLFYHGARCLASVLRTLRTRVFYSLALRAAGQALVRAGRPDPSPLVGLVN